MTFAPDWPSPPGDTIADALDELGWTRADLALATRLDASTVDGLCTGAVPIDDTIAEALARVLGSTPAFWLRREARYRERRREICDREGITAKDFDDQVKLSREILSEILEEERQAASTTRRSDER